MQLLRPKNLPAVRLVKVDNPPNLEYPPAPDPGGTDKETICWYLNAALAYIGVMAIPLSVEGAAIPPLGAGLGFFTAVAAVFSAGFC